MRRFYDLWYRWGTPPWVGGPRSELVRLVNDGTLCRGRAIDLGCGEGGNAIFLAQRGFSVVGVDFAPSAIAKARAKAKSAGVEVEFLIDDLTRLRYVEGSFDLLVDYGTLDDLDERQRDEYVCNVLQLVRPHSQFLLWCFEWQLSWGERLLTRVSPFGDIAMAPGEVQRRFGLHFEIRNLGGEQNVRGWPRGWTAYLMTWSAAR